MKTVLMFVLTFMLAQANEEEHLMYDLLLRHSETARLVRPVANASHPIIMDVEFHLVTLGDFTPKGGVHSGYGTLTTTAWLYKRWQNVHFIWDPIDYDGIELLAIPYRTLKEIWNPDLTRWDGLEMVEMGEADAVAYSSGELAHMPPMRFTLDCSPSATPDVTSCQAVFGPWIHTTNRLDFNRSSELHLESLKFHPEWTVVSGETTVEETKFDCCPSPYVSMTVTLNIAHNHAHHHNDAHQQSSSEEGDDSSTGDDESGGDGGDDNGNGINVTD